MNSASYSAALRPVWTLCHLGTFALGLLQLWNARQPVWLEGAGKAVWTRTGSGVGANKQTAPLVIGTA